MKGSKILLVVALKPEIIMAVASVTGFFPFATHNVYVAFANVERPFYPSAVRIGSRGRIPNYPYFDANILPRYARDQVPIIVPYNTDRLAPYEPPLDVPRAWSRHTTIPSAKDIDAVAHISCSRYHPRILIPALMQEYYLRDSTLRPYRSPRMFPIPDYARDNDGIKKEVARMPESCTNIPPVGFVFS